MRRWMMACVVLGVSGVSAGCVRQEPLALPDAGGARALILVVKEGGTVAANAVAIEHSAGVPVIVDRSAGAMMFALYYDRPLETLRLTEGSLAPAEGDCGRLLPHADRAYALPIEEGGPKSWEARAMMPPEISEVRFAVGGAGCPRLAEDPATLSVDVRCSTIHCRPRLEQQECALILPLSSCDIHAEVRGELGARGDACFVNDQVLGQCEEVDPLPEALRSLECTVGTPPVTCPIDLYAPLPEPRLEKKEVRLELDADLSQPGLERPPGGYLGELAVLPDRIAVATYDGTTSDWHCDNFHSRVHFLDPETLADTHSATVPDCLSQLIADPKGDGFLAAFGGTHPVLGRFDREARLLASTAYVPVPGEDLAPTSIAIGGASMSVIGVTLTQHNGDAPYRSRLFLADLVTLAPISPGPSPGMQFRELAPFDKRRSAIVDDVYEGGIFLDLDTGAFDRGPSLVGMLIAGISHAGQMILHPRTGLTLISFTGPSGGIFVFNDANDRIGRAGPFERYAETWAMIPWPADQELVLVGMTDLDPLQRTASVALFEPRTPRFLPGALVLGQGAVGRFHADEMRVWTTLPWSATVVRISAR